jgi:hypothetical protein
MSLGRIARRGEVAEVARSLQGSGGAIVRRLLRLAHNRRLE